MPVLQGGTFRFTGKDNTASSESLGAAAFPYGDSTIDIVNAMSITADTIKANASITSPNISGGTLNIGGGNFQVNSAGTMTLRSGPGNTGMVLNNSRLDVYDDAGVLRVRIGLL